MSQLQKIMGTPGGQTRMSTDAKLTKTPESAGRPRSRAIQNKLKRNHLLDLALATGHPAANLIQQGIDPASDEVPANHPAKLKGRFESPLKTMPDQVLKKPMTKKEKAVMEYKNSPAYSFMSKGRVGGLVGTTNGNNYWTENKRIVQSYSDYHELQRQLKLSGHGNIQPWQVDHNLIRTAGAGSSLSEVRKLLGQSRAVNGAEVPQGINIVNMSHSRVGALPQSVPPKNRLPVQDMKAGYSNNLISNQHLVRPLSNIPPGQHMTINEMRNHYSPLKASKKSDISAAWSTAGTAWMPHQKNLDGIPESMIPAAPMKSSLKQAVLFPDIKSRNASPRSTEKGATSGGVFNSGKKQSLANQQVGNLTTPFAYAKKSVPPGRANQEAIMKVVSTDRGQNESEVMGSNAASVFQTNRNHQIVSHICSSQQVIDAHGAYEKGSVADGHMALRTAGALAESATMEAVPGGSSQALLDDNLHAMNASRDSKGAAADSLNQNFDSIQVVTSHGMHDLSLNPGVSLPAKVLSSRNVMEFRSQNEVSTQGALIGAGHHGGFVAATLGTTRPRDLNQSHVQGMNGTPGLGPSGVAPSEMINSQQVSQQVLLAEHSLQQQHVPTGDSAMNTQIFGYPQSMAQMASESMLSSNILLQNNEGAPSMTSHFNPRSGYTALQPGTNRQLSVFSKVPSLQARRRRQADRLVRNFGKLYQDTRNESDNLRLMKEKYRIGDGEQSELMSMRSYEVPMLQQKSFNNSVRASGQGAAAKFNPMGQDTRSLSKGSADGHKATLECGGGQLTYSRAGAPRQEGSTIDSHLVVTVDARSPQLRIETTGPRTNPNQFRDSGVASPHLATNSPIGASGSPRKRDFSQENLNISAISGGGLREANVVDEESFEMSQLADAQERARQNVLHQVKPVLRKQTIHCSKNVMLILKSIEVQIHEELWDKEACRPVYKFVQPVYVPFSRLGAYMGLDKATLEMQVLKSVHLRQSCTSNEASQKDQFVFIEAQDLQRVNAEFGTRYRQRTQTQKLLGQAKKSPAKTYGTKPKISRLGSQLRLRNSGKRKDESPSPLRDADLASQSKHPLAMASAGQQSMLSLNSAKLLTQKSPAGMNALSSDQFSQDTASRLGNEGGPKLHKIKSNMLLDNGRFFRIVITLPSIEYRIESENFKFMKTLTLSELAPFIQSYFQDWHKEAISMLMRTQIFEKQLIEVQFRAANGLSLRPPIKDSKREQGRRTEPPSFDQINKRISNKLMQKKQEVTRRSHSLIPGQCSHENSTKDIAERPYDNVEEVTRDDLDVVVETNEKSADVLPSDMSVIESQVSTPKKRQPCIFELKEKKGADGVHPFIFRYDSVQDYEEHFCKPQNLQKLRGCFEIDSMLGQMTLSSFSITIKSLVSQFKYSKNLPLSTWKSICGFMKRSICRATGAQVDKDPQQLVDYVTSHFEKKALRDQQENFTWEGLNLGKYERFFEEVEATIRNKIMSCDLQENVLILQMLKKRLKCVNNDYLQNQKISSLITVDPLFNRPEYLGINTEPLPVERYLIEISYPTVQMSFKNGVADKKLDEADLEYLVRSQFYNWMPYLQRKYFRGELNLQNDKSQPRIEELFEHQRGKQRAEQEERLAKKIRQGDFELQDALARTDIKGLAIIHEQFDGLNQHSGFGTLDGKRGSLPPNKQTPEEMAEQLEDLGKTRKKVGEWFS